MASFQDNLGKLSPER